MLQYSLPLATVNAEQYRQHVAAAFHSRATEMVCAICRLALFLDPRYKMLISCDSEALHELMSTVRGHRMWLWVCVCE
jgi:hypothetical protein